MKSGALLGALLGASKSKSLSKPEKQIPLGYIVFWSPIVLLVVLLNSLYLVLLKSYILDLGTTKHMYNNQLRFIEFTLVPSNEVLVVGSSTVHIKGYSTISITL